MGISGAIPGLLKARWHREDKKNGIIICMRQGVVWSKNKDKLGRNDKVYVVNQTLMFGSLAEISEILRKYGKDEVRDIFLQKPLKIYSQSGVNFVAKMILGVKEDIDFDRYVKSLY